MKAIFLFFLILSCNFALSQPPGTKISGPVTVCDTIILNEGDMIELGIGTDEKGEFKFIYQPAHLSGVGKQQLGSIYSGLSYPIKSFREIRNKYSRKIIATISITGFQKVIEIEAAIKAEEIIIMPKKEN